MSVNTGQDHEILPVQQELEGVSLEPTKNDIRNADKKFSSIRALINSKKIIRKAQDYLSGKASIVKVILFDKTPDNNWQVSWHQDKTIAVSDKVSKDQFKRSNFKGPERI